MKRLKHLFQRPDEDENLALQNLKDEAPEKVKKFIEETDIGDPFANVREPAMLTEDEDGAPLPPEEQEPEKPAEDILEDIKPAPKKSSTKPSRGFDDRI